MTPEDEFTTNESDDRILIDMRKSKCYTDELEKLNRGIAVTGALKKAAAKKLRLRITGFSQVEYWYLLSNKGYIMSYKNYNILKADELYFYKKKIIIINGNKQDEEDIIKREEVEKEVEEFQIFIKIKFI